MVEGCARVASGAVVYWGMQLQIAIDAIYNGGLKVALGCEWCRRVIGERNCRLLDAL